MSKRTFVAAAVFAAGVGVNAADAWAQAQSVVEPKTITVTPFLSGSFGTSVEAADDSSLGIGAAISYDFTRYLGFEFDIGRAFDIAGQTADLDWSLTTFSFNAVYHLSVPRVTPYLTAGLGWEHSGLDTDDDDDDDEEPLDLTISSSTEVSWNYGGGVKYPINERFLVRADVRRFQAMDEAPDHWRVYGGVTFWVKR